MAQIGQGVRITLGEYEQMRSGSVNKCHINLHLHTYTYIHTPMVVWHQGANADGTNAQRTSTNAWDMSCVESHPYIDVSIHAYMRTSTRAYTHICITACVNLDMCAPLCLDTRTCNLHRTDSAKALIQRAFDIVRVPYDFDLQDAIQARQTGHTHTPRTLIYLSSTSNDTTHK